MEHLSGLEPARRGASALSLHYSAVLYRLLYRFTMCQNKELTVHCLESTVAFETILDCLKYYKVHMIFHWIWVKTLRETGARGGERQEVVGLEDGELIGNKSVIEDRAGSSGTRVIEKWCGRDRGSTYYSNYPFLDHCTTILREA